MKAIMQGGPRDGIVIEDCRGSDLLKFISPFDRTIIIYRNSGKANDDGLLIYEFVSTEEVKSADEILDEQLILYGNGRNPPQGVLNGGDVTDRISGEGW